MYEIFKNLRGKVPGDKTILAAVIVSEAISSYTLPVEGEELIFTSVPPTFPEYAAIMTAEIAGIAVDQLPEKALVDQKFFQLLTTDGTGKNVYGMIVMTDCVNLKDNTLISIHRELSGFLAGIGGGLFFVPNHASEAVKMHVLKALKRIGGKKIFIPLEVFLGAEEPAGFFGAFPRLPPATSQDLF